MIGFSAPLQIPQTITGEHQDQCSINSMDNKTIGCEIATSQPQLITPVISN